MCVITCYRFGIKLPRYQQIVNALTWMSHSQTLRRVSREYVIDLYLRPPVSRFRLMDFHLMDRIVRDANRSRLLLALSQKINLLMNPKLWALEAARHASHFVLGAPAGISLLLTLCGLLCYCLPAAQSCARFCCCLR